MKTKSFILGTLVVGCCLAAGAQVKQFDTDNDGTLDLVEVQKAADAKFARLDADNDGTLTAQELPSSMSANALAAANPDGDKTLDKTEYEKLVEKRFNAADTDHDGTLTNAELKTPAGRKSAGPDPMNRAFRCSINKNEAER